MTRKGLAGLGISGRVGQLRVDRRILDVGMSDAGNTTGRGEPVQSSSS